MTKAYIVTKESHEKEAVTTHEKEAHEKEVLAHEKEAHEKEAHTIKKRTRRIHTGEAP